MTKNRPCIGVSAQEHHTSEEIVDQILVLEKASYNFALQYTANTENARDLIQEATFKALKNRKKFIRGTNFKAWFFTIIRNEFINRRRKDQKKKKAIDSTKDLIVLTNNKEVSTENTAHQNIQTASIQELIDNLNENLRIAFTLTLKGYQYQEIADLLNLPIGTVKSRVHFARKELKILLGEEYPDRGAKKKSPTATNKPKENL